MKLDPTNVNAYFNRGSAYDSLGEYEKAVADYTHALDLDSSSADPEQSSGERHINSVRAVAPFTAMSTALTQCADDTSANELNCVLRAGSLSMKQQGRLQSVPPSPVRHAPR